MAKTAFPRKSAAAEAAPSIPLSNPGSFAAMFDPNAEAWSLIDLDDIEIRPQHRTEFNDDSLRELASSIDACGQIDPMVVRRATAGAAKPYVLVTGERRYRALRLLGRSQGRAVLRTLTDQEADAIQAAENIHRENLSQMDQARMVDKAVRDLGSVEAAARHFGKSAGWVSQQTMLLTLPAVTQRIVDENVSSDLAVIGAVASVEKKSGPEAAAAVVHKIKAADGKSAKRDIARNAAQKAKAEASAKKPAGRTAPKTAARPAKAPPKLDPLQLLGQYMAGHTKAPERDAVQTWVDELDDSVRIVIDRALLSNHAAGKNDRLNPGPTFVKSLDDGRFTSFGKGAAYSVAWLHGLVDRQYDLVDVLHGALTGL